MEELHRELRARIETALKNEKTNASRKIALDAIRKKYITLVNQLDLEQMKCRFREIKEKSLQNLSFLLELAKDRLRENGCQVYDASTIQDVY